MNGKQRMKKIKRVMAMVLAAAVLCSLWTVPSYAAVTRRCYTIASGNTTVYSNTGLTRKYGTIYGSDEVTVITVTSKYTKVTYPISRGRKTGYIRTSAILTGTTGNTYTARAKITTYRRPGGASYGYVSSGDRVMVLGRSGNYVQVKYPVSGGYKYGFISKSNADAYIYGTGGSQIQDGWYTIGTALKSSMCMDVNGGGTSNGTNIHIYASHGGANQRFYISSVGAGWYKIMSGVGNNMALDVANGGGNGANVQLHSYNGSAYQLWRFGSAGNGYYHIQNKLGYYLDVNGGGTRNNTNILVYQKHGGANQKWRLYPGPAGSVPVPANISYAPYRGVSYTDKGLSAARVAALNKAKQMVTIQWTAPCDIPTWASSKGVYNRAVATDGTSNKKFVKGKTYTGVPYSMTDHSYDDTAWASLLGRGITESSMTAKFPGYPVSGTAKGIDCSYFIYEAIKSAMGPGRISYQVTSTMMRSQYYRKIALSSMRPGDIFLSSGHVMMFVGKSGGRYAVFEADADDSKCSYNIYPENYIKRYGCYKYTGFSD